jgi:hypothetical protein
VPRLQRAALHPDLFEQPGKKWVCLHHVAPQDQRRGRALMMMERMVVASMGSIFFNPSVARIATKAEKSDVNRAKIKHVTDAFPQAKRA